MEPAEPAELNLYNLDDFHILWRRHLRKSTEPVHYDCDGFCLDPMATEPAKPSYPTPIYL